MGSVISGGHIPGRKLIFSRKLKNKLTAFEAKWSDKKKVKAPITWEENYVGSTFHVVTPNNYLEFVT